MNRLLSNKNCMRVAGLCAAAVLAAVLVGCQTPGRVVSVVQSPVCPSCKTETRTCPIKGLTYKKHVCPGCKTTTTLDHYTGDMTTINVCDRCKTGVTKCPQCASK